MAPTLPAGFVTVVRGSAVNEPTAEELTDRLFKLLDTDGDGKLSRKELEAAVPLSEIAGERYAAANLARIDR